MLAYVVVGDRAVFGAGHRTRPPPVEPVETCVSMCTFTVEVVLVDVQVAADARQQPRPVQPPGFGGLAEGRGHQIMGSAQIQPAGIGVSFWVGRLRLPHLLGVSVRARLREPARVRASARLGIGRLSRGGRRVVCVTVGVLLRLRLRTVGVLGVRARVRGLRGRRRRRLGWCRRLGVRLLLRLGLVLHGLADTLVELVQGVEQFDRRDGVGQDRTGFDPAGIQTVGVAEPGESFGEERNGRIQSGDQPERSTQVEPAQPVVGRTGREVELCLLALCAQPEEGRDGKEA